MLKVRPRSQLREEILCDGKRESISLNKRRTPGHFSSQLWPK